MSIKKINFASFAKLFLTGISLFGSGAYAASTNEYLLQWTPRKLATCQDDAAQIANKFGGMGVRVQSASCIKDLGHSSEISIFLDKDTIQPMYSALFGYRVGMQIDSIYRQRPLNQSYDLYHATGYFKTFNECLAAVPAFEEMYVQQTGLEPIASQCRVVGHGASYAMQIDGIGKPRRTLNRFEHLYFKRYVDDATLNLISSKLAADGFQIIDSRWDKEHLLAIGWGDIKLKIETPYLYESNYFSNISECESQKNIIRLILSNLGRSVLHLQCDLKAQRPKLAVLEETNANSIRSFIDVEKIGRFRTMDECTAQLSSLPNILDQFCSLDVDSSGRNQGYRLNRLFARDRPGAAL